MGSSLFAKSFTFWQKIQSSNVDGINWPSGISTRKYKSLTRHTMYIRAKLCDIYLQLATSSKTKEKKKNKKKKKNKIAVHTWWICECVCMRVRQPRKSPGRRVEPSRSANKRMPAFCSYMRMGWVGMGRRRWLLYYTIILGSRQAKDQCLDCRLLRAKDNVKQSRAATSQPWSSRIDPCLGWRYK